MFNAKTLKATASALLGALIIVLSSGAAQASVAAENLIGYNVTESNSVSSEQRMLRELFRRKQREDRRKDWNDRHHKDWNDRRDRQDYGAPPPPPPSGRRGHDYGAPPPPPRR